MRGRGISGRGATVRRGIALGLTVVGLWVFGLTGALQGAGTTIWALSQDAQGVLAPLRLVGEAGDGNLLPASSLIQMARDAVEMRLAQGEESLPQPLIPPAQQPIYAQGADDGLEEPQLTPAQYDDVINYTARGDDSGNYLEVDGIYLADRTEMNLSQGELEAIIDTQDYSLPQGGTILIVHTHGTEAYTQRGEDVYIESDPYRTTDCQQNVVQVGEAMAEIFRQAGYQVIHDTYLYDYPDYNSSYQNAREGVKDWLEEYPHVGLILDIHRDALTDQAGTPYRLVVEDEGPAQVMLVVGSDDGGVYHPDWRENLALATQIQSQLVADWGELARPITLRSSVYNQNLSTKFLLVEVGGHGNSLADALAGAECLAQSVVAALGAG